ncbi:MAG: MATE family efflux transporter [Clostridiaceae bacterium]|jgi:putative MATE family efflux protein|nr:MATE family efflux transporter [Clostridiaceae bacterium]
MKKNLTEGSVAKTLVKFAIPLLLANLLQALYAVADMIIVGFFSGSNSISAVSTSGQFTHVITMFLMGFATGATVLVAQYEGAGEHELQSKTIGNAIALFAVIAIIVTAISLFFGVQILNLLNTPAEAFDEAYRYYIICMSGTIFIMGYNVISSILRGMGDSKTPLLMVAIAAITNVIWDLILVGYYNMGAAGAAYATVGSQALSVILSFFIVKRRKIFPNFKRTYIRFEKTITTRLLAIGSPMAFQQTIVSFSFLFLTSIVNSFGVVASAASGIAGKINAFAILPAAAMMVAISAMSGQNIGANELKRAKHTMMTGMGLILPIVAVFSIVIFVNAASFIRIFSTEQDVVEAGKTFLRISCGEYIFLSVTFSQVGLLVGAGCTNLTLISSLVSSILLRVPLAALLSRYMGFNGVALAITLSPIASLVLNTIFIRSGRWKSKLVHGQP